MENQNALVAVGVSSKNTFKNLQVIGLFGIAALLIFVFALMSPMPVIAQQAYSRRNYEATRRIYALLEQEKLKKKKIDDGVMTVVAVELLKMADPNGRVTPKLQMVINRIENQYWALMTKEAKQTFQGALAQLAGKVAQLGGKVKNGYVVPKDNRSYFMVHPGRLTRYQSAPQLPETAGYVVIGTGLTGTSASYFLSIFEEQKAKGSYTAKKIVTLDQFGVGEGASGHNGGQILPWAQAFPDSEGLKDLETTRADLIRKLGPNLDEEFVRGRAKAEAHLLAQMGKMNSGMIVEIARKHQIDAKIKRLGLLHIGASSKEVAHFGKVAEFARQESIPIQMWTPEQIGKNAKVQTNFPGYFIEGFGSYSPYLFVNGLMEVALGKGVELYTQTKVVTLKRVRVGDANMVEVRTTRGTILAEKVILATDAYTRSLAPDLPIDPFQSHIVNLEHVRAPENGPSAITSNNGDVYETRPADTYYVDRNGELQSMLLFGGPRDVPARSVLNPEINTLVFNELMDELVARHPDLFRQPPRRLSTGVFGNTPDRFPISGPITLNGVEVPEIITFSASQGFGGSMSVFGGFIAAMASAIPERAAEFIDLVAPSQYFSLKRFQTVYGLKRPGSDATSSPKSCFRLAAQ